MPDVAHANRPFTKPTEWMPAYKPDCLFVMGMLAQEDETDHKGSTTDGCITQSCYLKCFHSPDLRLAPVPVRFVVRRMRLGSYLLPRPRPAQMEATCSTTARFPTSVASIGVGRTVRTELIRS